MIEYRVLRYDFKSTLTAGLLFKLVPTVDGDFTRAFICHTLEDTFRPGQPKIMGETCIPLGRYRLKLTHMPTLSAKYGHDMIEITSVPNFSGVAIHVGNTVADTNGCLLIGRQDVGDSIADSRSLYNELYPKIAAEIKSDEVWLQIIRS